MEVIRVRKDWGVMVQPHALPAFRTHVAIMDKVERRILFKTWGGIGDQICAEPTLRYGINKFKDCDIYLASECPELFAHLKFKRVFDLKDEVPNYANYLVFDTISQIYESKIIEGPGYYAMPNTHNFVWQFFSHMLVNCVDFPSQCALRLQLPVADKEIQLSSKEPDYSAELRGGVVIHPGKHWQSKTFPESFWNRVIAGLLTRGIKPIIIGADTDDNRGTVNVDARNCIDRRNCLSILESTWVCQNASVVLTNDSSPLHMAASGNAWIGFVATCKHPDMITHWRNGQWQWQEKNFGKGGVWDLIDFCPNKAQQIEAENVPQELLESWLPNPTDMSDWAANIYWRRHHGLG